MNLLFTVCGRAGSKGVKSKNCREFLGKPIVHFTLNAIKHFIDSNQEVYDRIDVCLSTDSNILVEQATAFDLPIFVLHREERLSGDSVGKKPVICDALQQAQKHFAVNYDYVADLDITSPLRTVEQIEAALVLLNANQNLEVVFSATEARRNPFFNMVIQNSEGYYQKVLESSYLTRQECPELLDMNASIYVYRNSFITDTSRNFVLQGRCGIVKVLDTGILDIDSENDYNLIQVIANYIFDNFEEYRRISQMR